MNEAQELALKAKGYDVIFDYEGDTIAINSKDFNEKKKKLLETQFGLRTFEATDGNLIFYNPEDWEDCKMGLWCKRAKQSPSGLYNLYNFNYVFWNNFDSVECSVIDLRNWDTKKVESFRAAFNETDVRSLNLAGWYTKNVWDTSYMFESCSNLRELNVSGWDTSSVINMERMFEGCESLQKLDLSDWDIRNVTSTFDMFDGCDALEEVILGPYSKYLESQLKYNCPDCKVIIKNNKED